MNIDEGLQAIEAASFPMSHRELSRVLAETISHASISRIAKTIVGFEYGSKEEAAEVWKKFILRPMRQFEERKNVVRIKLDSAEWATLCTVAAEESLQPFMLAYRVVAKYLKDNKKLF